MERTDAFDMAATDPAFLDVPARSTKPRPTGLTHVLDTGQPTEHVRACLTAMAATIDIWKFGFGTAYVDPQLDEKVAMLDQRGVVACVGGTLLEVAWLQDQVAAYLEWAEGAGFRCLEVSNGAVPMPIEDKRRLIRRATASFTVIAETGSKRTDDPVDPVAWRDEMLGDLDAGASLALAEGRASGTVGLYHPDGTVRAELAARLAEEVGLERVVFEAPRADQQAWFIRRFGANVSLGNVAPDGVVNLEAMRLGLRADTLHQVAAGRRGPGGAGDGRPSA